MQCGAGPILCIYASHYYNILYTPGRDYNTKAELATLWVLLFMVGSLNLCKVHIFGDSKIVVDWINGKSEIQVACLAARKAQVREFLAGLDWFSCKHIYRELNSEVDKLSKEALELQDGTFCFQEFYEGRSMEIIFYLYRKS